MNRTATQKIVSVVVFAIAGTALPFFIGDAEAQRVLTPAHGTECLVVTGSSPGDAPRVVGSREPGRESYGQGDELFVAGTGVASFTVGQQLQFVRHFGQVRHPDTDVVIAEAIAYLGLAEVVEVGADRAIVRVTMACREIEIGELLLEPDIRPTARVDSFPLYDPARLVTPDAADAVVILGELESVVSESGLTRAAAMARDSYAQRDVVIIDQGSADGWSAGDIVDLYRGESMLKTQTGGTEFTPLMLGIGLVVAVGDQAAAVLIVEGDLGVQIGDRVRHSRSSGS